jgi:CSLREA domain-containing protein
MRKYRWAVMTLILVLGLLAPAGHVRRAQASSYIVNTTDDSDDGTCDSTHCTLREAITKANSHTGSDYIHVVIPEDDPGCDDAVCTITLGSTLPTLRDTSGGTFVDGTSQPDTNPDGPDIVIDGSGATTCIVIRSQYNVITGFVISGCYYQIHISTEHSPPDEPGYNEIYGNYLGTNYAGTASAGDSNGGILISNSYNTIGGTPAQKRNIISGNGSGVAIIGPDAHHNTVLGNYIGTNADGTGAVPSQTVGVCIAEGSDNTIGGLTPAERNVISGNGTGIFISGTACYNQIVGNYIGTDASGEEAVPNDAGVLISSSAHHNYVGGLTSEKRNVISGNTGVGIALSDVYSNQILGNYLGLDASGEDALPNEIGVYIGAGAHDNVIGGTIAYNTNWGVRVYGATTIGNTIIARSIHSNGDEGIDLSDGGNDGILPPEITTASCTSASGTAPAGYGILLFSDYEDEGRQFHGGDIADGGGAWTVTLPSGMFSYPNLTATATDTNGNTSEFSSEVPNGCQYLWMPLGLKRY